MTSIWGSPVQPNPTPNGRIGSLREIDLAAIEQMVKEELGRRMKTWAGFDYFVVDDFHVLVKVYTRNNVQPTFRVIMELVNGKLYVTEVDDIEAMVPPTGSA